MQKTAIMTDSNCGIFPAAGMELGISIVPMPVIINGETYFEGVNLSQNDFYRLQGEGAEITSSLPSPGTVIDLWEQLLTVYDEVLYIPMSSGLSNTCASAAALAQDYKDRVFVADNLRISVTQMQSVLDAQKMAAAGMAAAEIKARLEREALDATIYIAVDTLEYLKKGGRVTAAGAAIGSVLNIKPVLSLTGEKLDAYAKVRGMKAAFRTMCKALDADLRGRLKSLHDNGELTLAIANTPLPEGELEQWKCELQKAFPGEDILYGPLSLSIGCHVGPGAIGIGAVRRLK